MEWQMCIDEIVNTWRINNAINMKLLGACRDETFELKPGKGKTIRSNFVHIIGFRRAWIEEKMWKEAEAVEKLDWKTATRSELESGLEVSSALMEELFRKLSKSNKGGKWTPVRFLAYAIAHEANHRGQIEIALRVNGHEPTDAFLYSLWEWK